MARKNLENLSFEQSIAELEGIVSQLEQGDLDLEQALKQFERGVVLAQVSQQKLEQAQQRVQILLNPNDEHLAEFTESGQ